jgi:hypothetical protein
MVVGYPRRTNRYLTSYDLAFRRDFDYPEHIRLYRQTLDVIADATQGDPEGTVRVAGKVKGINNRLKNNLGMLDGFRRFDLVDGQIAKERRFEASLEGAPAMLEAYGDLLDGFRALYEERLEFAMGDLILDAMVDRGTLLSQAMQLYTWSLEKAKDDMDRDLDFMDREIPVMKTGLRIFDMGYHERSDREVLRMLMTEALALPEDRRIEAIDRALGSMPGPDPREALDSYLDHLYAGTHLDVAESRLRMFDLSHEELMAENDPFIDLAAMLYEADRARLEREKAYDGAMTLLRPRWIEALSGLSDKPLYPDANGTMRLNYGIVKGY